MKSPNLARRMNRSFARFILAPLYLVLWCSGCVTDGKLRTPVSTVEVLIKADRAFALYAQQHGVASAFREFAATEALSLPMGEAPIHGREAIFRAMSISPAGDLRWRPVGADLARSGDLGYTWGTYEFRPQDAAMRHGKYVTIWKKQRDGSWKYVVDIGNASPPPN